MNPERTILVVEDNPLTRKMLRLTLEVEGYSVIEAADGRAALASAAEHMPALVLQDVILPDMNGFELVRQLRALPHGADTPILALTGFLSRIKEARSVSAGFTALLVKPVEPSLLLDSIKPYFPPSSAMVSKGARILIVDDDAIQLKLTRIQLELLGYEVTTAESGKEALSQAQENPPDAIASDVLMPQLDGFQLCRELRRGLSTTDTIPIVLSSAWYQTQSDRDLARRVGANALVTRTSDLAPLAEALVIALRDGAPSSADSTVEFQTEHTNALTRQLKRQIKLNADMSRRCTLQGAQISLLSGVADALARRVDTEVALRDILAATLDAAGISKGAIFIRVGDGRLTVRHAIGFLPAEQAELPSFFGELSLLEHVVERQVTIAIPSFAVPDEQAIAILTRAGVTSAQVVPLVSEGRSAGAILLAALRTDVTTDDSISFARAMGNQVAQSLELASSFARLSESEQRYRAVTEAANDAISIITDQGVIIEANRSLEQALGLPRDQLIGRNVRDLGAFGDQFLGESNSEVDGAAISGHTSRRSITRPDGSVVQMEFSDKRVDVGGTKLVFSIGRDVSEQVQTQAHLMVSDRLASVGMLAAGIAHEINNPLAAVLANLECAASEVVALKERYEASPALRSLADEIGEATNAGVRMRQIVSDLRIFSRTEEEKNQVVNIRTVVDSALRIAWNEIRHRARLIKEYAEVPAILANESRLGQVFLNLIVNATQSMPEGAADRNSLHVKTGFDAGKSRVFAEFTDTGCGMSPDVQRRLFTPFFTTKPRGVGTGLGLTICQRIIASLGGTIEVESQIGRGTTFRVLLQPTSAVPSNKTRAATDGALQRRGRILVIDDESLILSVVKRVLSDHDVVGLTDAREALARLDRGDKFDLILCDLMMPVVTGMDFWQRLVERRDEHLQRVVFLTGGAITPCAQDFFERFSNQRIDKPFEAQVLRSLVNERLN